MYCSKCGAPLPYGTYGNVKCEHCNGTTYVPTPEEKREMKEEKREKEKPDTTVSEKPSKAWYLAPILSSWLGGIIAYYALKGRDKDMAKKCLWLGIGITALYFIVGIIIGILISIPDDNGNDIPLYTSTPTSTPPPRTYVIFSDSFDSNVNDWPVKTEESEWSKQTWSLTNGKYRWEALAHQGFQRYVRPLAADPATDFYLTVDARLDSGPIDSKYGVVFRAVDDDNFYYFSVNDIQQFSFWLQYRDEWINLIDSTVTSAIRPGEVNRIGVVAEGSHFSFFINDQFVAEAEDARLVGGDVGVSIELDSGAQSVFEFDNLKLTTTTPPLKIDYGLKYDAIDLLPYTIEGFVTEEPPQVEEPDAEMLELGCLNQATSSYSVGDEFYMVIATECNSPRHAENVINRIAYEMGKEGIFSRDIQVYRGVNGKFGYDFAESDSSSACMIGWNWDNFAVVAVYGFDGWTPEDQCLDYVSYMAEAIAQNLPTQ